ncbi:NAD(P)H-dependent glycerol-3-phosphate dehydrogenase [Mycoplasma sp. Mirounga ES2805-ORL]|uniref:NAD(P)H-dependent glycerol-3-phosphate dehydrogenase n=1 Tax=Mycoplasma sp. Mirounga ES2805-ORL TaxID=754514 RepID=UPI003530390F
MKKITFIGTGAWASGLATVLAKNNHKITMWGIDQNEVDDINQGINSKYFGTQKFNNPKNIVATLNLNEALEDFDYMVLAVPSSAFNNVIKQIKDIVKDKKINIINVAKGIDFKTNKFFSTVILDEFKGTVNNICSIIGPSFAVEVFENKLTMVNVVGQNPKFLKEISQIFNNDRFRLVVNDDEHGSELFAALKNVLAIGIGMVKEFHPYQNPQAALLSVGVKEIHNIYRALFPDSNDILGFELAGTGDIFLTCSSPKSRNFTFGTQVAKYGIQKALEINNKTVEGYHTAKTLNNILKKFPNLYVPFLRSIIDVLHNGKNHLDLLDFIEFYR